MELPTFRVISVSYTHLRLKGLCYMQKGKYDVAETMLLQALSLFEELDHEIYGAGVAACYNYLGDVYRKQDHLDEAMAYYGDVYKRQPLERYFTGAAPDPGKRRPGIFKDRG